MVFSSMIFLWVFLPVVLVTHRLLGLLPGRSVTDGTERPTRAIAFQNAFLLVASLVFYAWGEPRYIVVMLFTIVINYVAGMLIGHLRSSRAAKGASLVLAASVILDLAVLGYFKYFSTVLSLYSNLRGIDPANVAAIALPVGISFYTFQAISYVVDVYRGNTLPQRNLLLLALYITFFPQLVAGPIVRYSDINKQLSSRSVTPSQTAYGVKRFLYGLAKKVLVANYLAATVDVIFALPFDQLSTALAWIGALLYSLQIYFDFSGYSDMAIGLGRMFGFSFTENFNLPYLSRSIREFWRRWHISLSTWFREYVYIPLGGNRKGQVRTYLNLLIVFFVTGIWHGAGLSFIAWGLYHGAFMLIERAGLGKVLDDPRNRVVSRLYTLFVVMVGWVLFRADRLVTALAYLRVMFVPQNPGAYSLLEVVGTKTLAIMGVALLLCGILQAALARSRNEEPRDLFVADEATLAEASGAAGELAAFAALLLLFALCCLNLISGSYNPFIYFRF